MGKEVKSKNCVILIINVTSTKNYTTIYELTNFYWFHLNLSLTLFFYLPLIICHISRCQIFISINRGEEEMGPLTFQKSPPHSCIFGKKHIILDINLNSNSPLDFY